MYGRSHQSVYGYSIAPAAPNPPDMFNSVTDPRVWLVGATWTSTLAPNKILETRVGYNSFSQVIGIGNNVDPKSLGIDTGPLDPLDFGVPYVDYFSSFGYIGGVGGYPITTAPNANLDVSSSLTWIKDKHTLKFGGNYQRATTYSVRNRARTTLEFTTGTLDPVDSITAMLLGRADYAARSFGSTVRHLQQSSLGFFVNDDWKLSPTLHRHPRPALRRQQRPGRAGQPGRELLPRPGAREPGPGDRQALQHGQEQLRPARRLRLGRRRERQDGAARRLCAELRHRQLRSRSRPVCDQRRPHGGLHEPQPRRLLGEPGRRPGGPARRSGGAPASDPNSGAGGDYVCILPGQPIFGNSPSGVPPFNVFAVDPDLKTPYYHLFHLSFQREVFKNNVLTLSYVGSRGHDQLMVRDLNAPPVGSDWTDPQPNRPFAASTRTSGTSSSS